MEPFMGQIMQVGFTFAPRGWAQCQGQLLSIAQQSALFSLLGTTYGGNGQTNFALPNAASRVFVGTGQGPGLSSYQPGQVGGTENTTLTTLNMPMHTHTATFTGALQSLPVGRGDLGNETASAAEGSLLGTVYESGGTTPVIYAPAGTQGTPVNLGGLTGNVQIAPSGGSQPFSLLTPYLAITTNIALEGIFPSRN